MWNKIDIILFAAILFAAFPLSAESGILLPDIFCDHMILQREMPIPVWGSATKDLTLEVTFNHATAKTKSDNFGNWKVNLPTMQAGGPFEMSIRTKNDTVYIKDIYIGEVWICSGQSNMEWPLQQTSEGDMEIPAAEFPLIRFFHLKKRHDTYNTPYSQEELKMFNEGKFFHTPKWELCCPQTAAVFSGVGYFFGKKIFQSLTVPVGLIQAAVGGSPAQSWISEEALAIHPQLEHLVSDSLRWIDSEIIHPWLAERAKENWPLGDQYENTPLPGHPFAPFYLYEAAIKPLGPYGMRGVIWYQGESNATHPESYPALMEMLLQSWRKLWGQGNFPFYFVQLPKIGDRSLWPEFREAQQECLSNANTGMIITIDEGHPTDVHPGEKAVIGQRLAGLALMKTYHHNILAESPVLSTHHWNRKLGEITLLFENTYEGLKTVKGLDPEGLVIQGFLGQGTKEVIIELKRVIIVDHHITLIYNNDFLPTMVKYAWAPFPESNLVNSEGLPMAPFKINLKGSN